jgi:hypothetical protein
MARSKAKEKNKEAEAEAEEKDTKPQKDEDADAKEGEGEGSGEEGGEGQPAAKNPKRKLFSLAYWRLCCCWGEPEGLITWAFSQSRRNMPLLS